MPRERGISSIVRIGRCHQGCRAVGAQRALIGKHISRHKERRLLPPPPPPAIAASKNAPNTVMVARRDAGIIECVRREIRQKSWTCEIALANKNSTKSIFAPRAKHSKRSRISMTLCTLNIKIDAKCRHKLLMMMFSAFTLTLKRKNIYRDLTCHVKSTNNFTNHFLIPLLYLLKKCFSPMDLISFESATHRMTTCIFVQESRVFARRARTTDPPPGPGHGFARRGTISLASLLSVSLLPRLTVSACLTTVGSASSRSRPSLFISAARR